MSQDLTLDAQSQADAVGIFQPLLETLVSLLSDFDESSSHDLLDILKGLREVYESSSNERDKQELADLLVADIPADTCSAIYGFISKVFSGKS